MKETHAGDRVPELDDLGVSGLVDPHVVEEVRQVPLEPAGTLCHERGLGVSGPPGVFLGARGERSGVEGPDVEEGGAAAGGTTGRREELPRRGGAGRGDESAVAEAAPMAIEALSAVVPRGHLRPEPPRAARARGPWEARGPDEGP